jgi:hypothetical protein
MKLLLAEIRTNWGKKCYKELMVVMNYSHKELMMVMETKDGQVRCSS